ncbi:MAG: glycoside hydrolase family 3 N-terminal domain-containing protein [Pelagibacteraceae bacterium]
MAIIKKQIKPVIFGLSGTSLTKSEISLIKNYTPYGFIIFKRNINSLIQLKKLILSIKSYHKQNPIIMIDHEGGRINRFDQIFSQKKFSGQYFGELYKNNLKNFFKEANYFINFNTRLFRFLGINTIAYPVMDLRYQKTHNVIGDRSFGSEVKTIKKISAYFINKFEKFGIFTIAKHAPGHGLALKDSHYFLPEVSKSKDYLIKNDFNCFKDAKSKFLMTAHIKYKSIDDLTATYSKKIISILRNHLNYKGMIMTDDICMKALKGSLKYRVKQPLIAGCNIILHCNGNNSEMEKVVKYL